MADTSTTKRIMVSGHVEDIRGIFHIKLSWTDETGKRGRKSISTGLEVKGNKKRAEDMMIEAKREQENVLKGMPGLQRLLFADFMEQWLEAIKSEVKQTTYGGYQLNVEKAIAPYFRKKRILLQELTAEDINDFYTEQLKRIKATSVHKFHA